MPKFTATDIFHHPEGVVLPGETADLPAAVGGHGVDLGVLVPAQATVPAPSAPAAPAAPEPKE